MFEGFDKLTKAEQENVKTIHKNVRKDYSYGPRMRNLAWGFIRGFKFHRIERTHRVQLVNGKPYTHNLPNNEILFRVLSKHVQVTLEDVTAWLVDPTGAIAPPPREKRPYTPPQKTQAPEVISNLPACAELIPPGTKLYVIVRSDLKPGLQIPQAMHAARQFAEEHPELESQWFKGSNTLAVLAAKSETHLRKILQEATWRAIKSAVFREPDRNFETTAICLEPGERSKQLCRKLPLALS